LDARPGDPLESIVLSFRKVARVDELADQASSVGALADPTRRALYRYVIEQAGPVSREEAAAAVEVPAHSVKFHLDRLLDAGLLEVEFRRLSGRTGPGAGRPSKLYRRASRQVSVSLPERRYDLAGHVLAEAVDRSVRDGVSVVDAVRCVATEFGHRIAAEALDDDDGNADREAPGPGEAGGHPAAHAAAHAGEQTGHLGVVSAVLARQGYEPRTVADELCLANCPFDRLAAEHTNLVCGMNVALISGLLDELDIRDLRAVLSPAPGLCCVRVTP
jgi:predicted ArsR family transcriptional regulator